MLLLRKLRKNMSNKSGFWAVLLGIFFLVSLIVFLSAESPLSIAAPKDCCREQCAATDPPICNGVTVNICDYCDVNKYFYYRCSHVSCPGVTCTDADKDGYGKAGSSGCLKAGVDCSDSSAVIHPSASEVCGNGIDEDCTGSDLVCAPTCTDIDKDGYGTAGSSGCPKPGTDCNDANPAFNPGATEVCGNGIDEDCASGDETCPATFNVSVFSPTAHDFKASSTVFFWAKALGGVFPYRYTWQSDRDGVLSSGMADSFSTRNLSVGNHVITLSATDSASASAARTINLTVKATSSLFASISPPDGSQFSSGALIFFSSFASGGIAPYSYTWSSDRDGPLGNSSNFSSAALSAGDHKITLTVADSGSNIYATVTNIKVIAGMAISTHPAPGAYEQGSTIFLSTGVVGGTAPYSYVWNSDKDGLIGTANFFMKTDLSLGIHQITVGVTDATGAKASKTFPLEIVKPQCIDDDKDGYGQYSSIACASYLVDCNDTPGAGATIHPGATEICPNAIDENCNGSLTDCPVTITVLSPAADGQSFAWGSRMNIRIRATPVTTASVTIYDSTDKYVKSVSLYDDGTHNDGAAGDTIWGNDTTLVLNGGDYYLNAAINSISYSHIRSFKASSSSLSCTTLVNKGSSADKLDIVFIADQYTAAEMPNFVTKVQTAYTYLLGIKPYDTQTNRVNIHRIDSPVNLGCRGWSQPQPECNILNIQPIANLCPNDEVVVIVDGNFRSYAGGYSVVSALDSRFSYVVVHELGHSFAGLADEYVESGKIAATSSVIASVNCDVSSTCSKWNSVPGTGCYGGCMYQNAFYRSVSNGIMRNVSIDFGVVNINRINTIFNAYK